MATILLQYTLPESPAIVRWHQARLAACRHKAAFATEDEAQRWGAQVGLYVYACDLCTYWHLTRQPQEGAA